MSATMSQWHGSQQPIGPKPKTIKNVVLPLDGSQRLTISSTDRANFKAVRSHPPHSLCRPGSAAYKRGAQPSRAYFGGNARDCARRVQRLPCRSNSGCGSAAAVLTACNVHSHRWLKEVRMTLVQLPNPCSDLAPERIVLLAPERGDRAWVIRRVLLAHDGPPTSDCATAPAAEIARSARAEVIALHVAARRGGSPGAAGEPSCAPIHRSASA